MFANGEHRGFAPSSRREQQSPGLLHLMVRIPHRQEKRPPDGGLFYWSECWDSVYPGNKKGHQMVAFLNDNAF